MTILSYQSRIFVFISCNLHCIVNMRLTTLRLIVELFCFPRKICVLAQSEMVASTKWTSYELNTFQIFKFTPGQWRLRFIISQCQKLGKPTVQSL